MIEHTVVISGGGPTGLTLAAELALAGVDVAIVERRSNQDLVGARAGGLHPRTIEVFDQRGITDRFLTVGQKHPMAITFRKTRLDLSDLPSRHNYFLSLWQQQTERILAKWIQELGVRIYRGRELKGFEQSEATVEVALSDGSSLRAKYLVGCDGGRSLVRKAAGIEFAGWEATKSWLIAELQFTDEPAWGFRDDATGTHAIGKLDDGQGMRVVLTEQGLKIDGEPTLTDVREALIAIYGNDYGSHSPTSISRFTDATRQAVSYRDRRVLLAGDAAHVHPPMGGQGLNIGVQDAANLGWKLAQVVKGISNDSLLDTYQAERHPVAARVLRYTMAHVALQRTDERTEALGETISEMLKLGQVRKQMTADLSGLDIRYGAGEGHPLIGRRIPDLDLVLDGETRQLFTLLHNAEPLLLNLGEPGEIDIGGWADRVRLVDAQCSVRWELPVVGAVSAPSAVLVRPDGYVAWAGDPADPELTDALGVWFGPPNRSTFKASAVPQCSFLN
jgi:3-(3-hydroxy-phenyl)propionate hydroxylase